MMAARFRVRANMLKLISPAERWGLNIIVLQITAAIAIMLARIMM